MNDQRDIKHICIFIFMTVDFLHQFLVVMVQGINRQSHMVPIDHDQAVVPYPVCLELIHELTKGKVGIILGPDIIPDKSALIPLRQLHLVFLLRNSERMMG
ncbi:hypothetical protein D3C73_549210 [compost metagenome]